VRRAFRYLRHPQIRKRPWLTALTRPLFSRDLWQPCRFTIAGGLSIGLFCAMLPIPFQMLLAALASMRARVNIPIAMAACWVSNPFTQIWIWLSQERLGDWIRSKSDSHMLHMFDFERRVLDLVTLNIASFIVGFLAMGVILSLLAYPIVYGISAFLPNRGKNVRFPRKSNHLRADEETKDRSLTQPPP
ncbi:MAG: DUF2062 domain-containing protein, partial [Akkermansiaceae bacterium]